MNYAILGHTYTLLQQNDNVLAIKYPDILLLCIRFAIFLLNHVVQHEPLSLIVVLQIFAILLLIICRGSHSLSVNISGIRLITHIVDDKPAYKLCMSVRYTEGKQKEI